MYLFIPTYLYYLSMNDTMKKELIQLSDHVNRKVYTRI